MSFRIRKPFFHIVLLCIVILMMLLLPIGYLIIRHNSAPPEIVAGTPFRDVTDSLGSPQIVESNCEDGTLTLSYQFGGAVLGFPFANVVLDTKGHVISYSVDN